MEDISEIQGGPYQEMLSWPDDELKEELDIRIARLDRVIHDLERVEQQQSPLAALIGVLVIGLLSFGTLALALLPFTRMYQRNAGSFGYFSEIVAILVAPVFLYGLYIVYANYQGIMQRRHSAERFKADASQLLKEAREISLSENLGFHKGQSDVAS